MKKTDAAANLNETAPPVRDSMNVPMMSARTLIWRNDRDRCGRRAWQPCSDPGDLQPSPMGAAARISCMLVVCILVSCRSGVGDYAQDRMAAWSVLESAALGRHGARSGGRESDGKINGALDVMRGRRSALLFLSRLPSDRDVLAAIETTGTAVHESPGNLGLTVSIFSEEGTFDVADIYVGWRVVVEDVRWFRVEGRSADVLSITIGSQIGHTRSAVYLDLSGRTAEDGIQLYYVGLLRVEGEDGRLAVESLVSTLRVLTDRDPDRLLRGSEVVRALSSESRLTVIRALNGIIAYGGKDVLGSRRFSANQLADVAKSIENLKASDDAWIREAANAAYESLARSGSDRQMPGVDAPVSHPALKDVR